MSNNQHIRSSFDRALESLQANMLKMGGLVEVNIMDAAKALEDRDLELAEKVRSRDKQIDDLEEVINDGIARFIALESPAATDLRLLLSILKVSSMVVIWVGIALRIFPPKAFECWAGLAARQHKLRRKKKENALTEI